jgi:hypothetical protein
VINPANRPDDRAGDRADAGALGAGDLRFPVGRKKDRPMRMRGLPTALMLPVRPAGNSAHPGWQLHDKIPHVPGAEEVGCRAGERRRPAAQWRTAGANHRPTAIPGCIQQTPLDPSAAGVIDGWPRYDTIVMGLDTTQLSKNLRSNILLFIWSCRLL